MKKYNWVAQDEDGEVHEYINKPSTEEAAGPWWGKACIGNFRQASDPTTKAVTNWKESLIDLSKNDYIIKKGILMATRKHAALIHAWADGAIIQYQNSDGKWADVVRNDPSWRDDETYRIKPATRTVKFRNYIHDCEIKVHVPGTAIPPLSHMEWLGDWQEVEIEL